MNFFLEILWGTAALQDCSTTDSVVHFGTDGSNLIQDLIDLDRPLLALKSEPSIVEMYGRISRRTTTMQDPTESRDQSDSK